MRLFSKWFIDTKIMKTWLEFMPRGGFGHSRLIFYLWFAKLTIIKYLTRSTPTRAIAQSGFEYYDQNKKLGTRWIFGHK